MGRINKGPLLDSPIDSLLSSLLLNITTSLAFMKHKFANITSSTFLSLFQSLQGIPNVQGIFFKCLSNIQGPP